MYAQVIHLTGWTVDDIGELTPRQLVELLPALAEAISGKKPELPYMEAVRKAGVMDRVAGVKLK